MCKPHKLYTHNLLYTNSIALYCRAITMLPAIKHHLSSPQTWMGQQGYMPKVRPSGMHDIMLYVTIPCTYLSTLRTSDFSFTAKKTTTCSHSHQCKLHDSKCSDQYLHTYWRHWSHYWYSQTSDFQEALWKVIICPDRYPLTNINARCSVFATHLYFWKQSFGELPE